MRSHRCSVPTTCAQSRRRTPTRPRDIHPAALAPPPPPVIEGLNEPAARRLRQRWLCGVGASSEASNCAAAPVRHRSAANRAQARQPRPRCLRAVRRAVVAGIAARIALDAACNGRALCVLADATEHRVPVMRSVPPLLRATIRELRAQSIDLGTILPRRAVARDEDDGRRHPHAGGVCGEPQRLAQAGCADSGTERADHRRAPIPRQQSAVGAIAVSEGCALPPRRLPPGAG